MKWPFLALVLMLTAVSFGEKTHQAKSAPRAACAPLSGQSLKCFQFGFIYTIPFGWVDRTAEISGSQGGMSGEAQSSQTLLAVFERPPDASGDTINSAVVIASESLKNYSGVKSAADYFGPVTDIAQKEGLAIANEPYEFTAGTKKLVRADYSKPRGALTMFQSTLVMIEKGEIVSFTFVGGSEDEVNGLIAQLKFGPTILH